MNYELCCSIHSHSSKKQFVCCWVSNFEVKCDWSIRSQNFQRSLFPFHEFSFNYPFFNWKKKMKDKKKHFIKCTSSCFMKLLIVLTNSIILHCRNIIHGSDGPETAKDEINLWFKPEELVTYTSSAEKWVYGVNWWTFFILSFLPAAQDPREEGVETYLW